MIGKLAVALLLALAAAALLSGIRPLKDAALVVLLCFVGGAILLRHLSTARS